MHADMDAGPPVDVPLDALGVVMLQGTSAGPQRVELCFGQRYSLPGQVGGLLSGDWQERPILGVVAILPVDYFSKNRDELLSAAGACEGHDVEVRFIDQLSHTSQRTARLPRAVRSRGPAMLAAELLSRPLVTHHDYSDCDA